MMLQFRGPHRTPRPGTFMGDADRQRQGSFGDLEIGDPGDPVA